MTEPQAEYRTPSSPHKAGKFWAARTHIDDFRVPGCVSQPL